MSRRDWIGFYVLWFLIGFQWGWLAYDIAHPTCSDGHYRATLRFDLGVECRR